jgi:hypothetical protein
MRKENEMTAEQKKQLMCKDRPMYFTYRQASEITGKTVRTIYNLVYGIRDEIAAGRYPAYVLPGTMISWYALVDYCTYRKDLTDKYRRKTVPPFNPEEIARLSLFEKAV